MSTPRIRAAESGCSKYEGRPCKTCGNTIRHTNNASCVKCMNELSKKHSRLYRAKIRSLLQQAKERV